MKRKYLGHLPKAEQETHCVFCSVISHLCSRYCVSSRASVTQLASAGTFHIQTTLASIVRSLTSAHRLPVETEVILVPGPPGYTALPAGLWP